MMGRILGYAVAFALPGFLAAQTPQIPNEHASDRGKPRAALHSQGAQHRATHRRGKVVHAEDVDHDRDDRTKTEDTDHDRDDRGRNPNAATPAKRATPAVPANGRKSANPGQSGNHRP